MGYKVLDIYKDLPGTNCGDCGRSGCFPFASSVYLEGADPAECPHLDPGRLASMTARLAEGRASGEGKKPASVDQALAHLKGRLAETDLASAAARAAAAYDPGPPEAVRLAFLGTPYRITRDDAVPEDGAGTTIWVKIFLMIYLTRATGAPPAGQWAAYRELPNTVSKSRSFEACASRIADAFGGDLSGLDRAVRRLGGETASFGSADRVYRFRALPRVDLLLLFWDREEEFPARASILVDRGVLDYLDQEALVFLAEAFAALLCGGSLDEVVA